MDEMPRRARSAGEGDADRSIFVDLGLSPLGTRSGLSQQFAYSSAAAAAAVVVDAAAKASSAAFAVSVIAANAAVRFLSLCGGADAGHGTAGRGASKNPAKGSTGLLPSFELAAVEDTVPSTGGLNG